MTIELEKNLTEVVRNLRGVFDNADRSDWQLLRNFPTGACGVVSELLGRYLQEKLSVSGNYVCGEVYQPDMRSHAWVDVGGIIIDITADQFGQPPVIVTRESAWHLQWNITLSRKGFCMPDDWPSYPHAEWNALIRGMR